MNTLPETHLICLMCEGLEPEGLGFEMSGSLVRVSRVRVPKGSKGFEKVSVLIFLIFQLVRRVMFAGLVSKD